MCLSANPTGTPLVSIMLPANSSTISRAPQNRKLVIAGSVVLFHVALLWALQSGLLRRAVAVIVPVAILSEIITPPVPVPVVEPPAPVAKPPEPIPEPVAMKPQSPPPPAPAPVATPTPVVEAPNAPAAPAPSPFSIGPIAPAPPRAEPAPELAPPAAALSVELPSSDADYLQNPKPAYPPASKRLGEQGKVVVGVLIGVDGTAQQVQVRQTSGFARLDQAALATALKWRYVPGKRGGVAEAMWFNVPINFVLE